MRMALTISEATPTETVYAQQMAHVGIPYVTDEVISDC